MPKGLSEVEVNVGRPTGKLSYTLTCLLVALAIATILLALRSVRPRPHPHAVCLSNVNNISLALQMYVDDNDDRFPPASDWSDRLSEYVRNRDVYRCDKADGLECGFAYNAFLSGASLADIADPSQVVVIFESERGWNAAGGPELLPDEPRHLGGDNYGFADASGKWLPRKKLPDGIWAKEPDADVIWEVGVEEAD